MMKLQIWQDGWTATNSRGKWVDDTAHELTDEMVNTVKNSHGEFFLLSDGTILTHGWAPASAARLRIVKADA